MYLRKGWKAAFLTTGIGLMLSILAYLLVISISIGQM
jgi:hypothetical protein